MTIEIHQLIIRAVVDEGPAAEATRADTTRGAIAPASAGLANGASPQSPEERQALITACVREVVRRLDRARER